MISKKLKEKGFVTDIDLPTEEEEIILDRVWAKYKITPEHAAFIERVSKFPMPEFTKKELDFMTNFDEDIEEYERELRIQKVKKNN